MRWRILGLLAAIVVAACSETTAASEHAQFAAVAADGTCIQSAGPWANMPFADQAGGFVIEFDATPSANAMDGVMGLSLGAADAYSDLASIARFWTSGRIEVRSGSSYVSTPVTYTAGTTYRFRLTVNVATHRYSASVASSGGAEVVLGTNLAFRTEQSAVPRLNNLAAKAVTSGTTLGVCLVSVQPVGTPPPPTDTVLPPPPPPPPPPPATGPGIWLSPAEIAALPTSGAGWSSVKSAADKSCGTPSLSNQDSNANVCVMAKALVYARTGSTSHRDGVLAALRTVASSGTYSGRALALGRELAAYVISADLVGLATLDPALNATFRTKIDQLRRTSTSGGAANLVECHNKRPNNWGTWCGFSRIVAALYLNDRVDLDRAANVFRGWTGERAAYASFVYGDLSWQANPSQPVGINPRGSVKQGHDIDGVLPDDQRRCGSFQWPPCVTDYIWGALEGALPTAYVLHRAGYSWALASGDSAVVRAYRWINGPGNNPPVGNDTWQPYLVNYLYGTTYPQASSVTPGKNIGWTEWTHRR